MTQTNNNEALTFFRELKKFAESNPNHGDICWGFDGHYLTNDVVNSAIEALESHDGAEVDLDLLYTKDYHDKEDGFWEDEIVKVWNEQQCDAPDLLKCIIESLRFSYHAKAILEKQTQPEPAQECEACEGYGRINCSPDNEDHSHPCDTCRPDDNLEYQRGVEFGQALTQAQPVDVEALKAVKEYLKWYDDNNALDNSEEYLIDNLRKLIRER